jgi:hypothetical protein
MTSPRDRKPRNVPPAIDPALDSLRRKRAEVHRILDRLARERLQEADHRGDQGMSYYVPLRQSDDSDVRRPLQSLGDVRQP